MVHDPQKLKDLKKTFLYHNAKPDLNILKIETRYTNSMILFFETFVLEYFYPEVFKHDFKFIIHNMVTSVNVVVIHSNKFTKVINKLVIKILCYIRLKKNTPTLNESALNKTNMPINFGINAMIRKL